MDPEVNIIKDYERDGKRTIIIHNENKFETNLVMTLYKVDNFTTEETNFDFKIKCSSYSSLEEIDKIEDLFYNRKKELSASYMFDDITIKIKEFDDEEDNIQETEYYIYILKQLYPIQIYNSIYGTNEKPSYSVKGVNKGKTLTQEFASFSKDFYIYVVCRAKKDDTEFYISYGAVQIVSHNYIFVLIIVGCVIAIVVGVILFCVFKKRNRVQNLPEAPLVADLNAIN